MTFDAVVVGAGIAGTATAWFLREAGLRVALIDAQAPGWGASGRNPGFLWLQTKATGLPMQFSLQCRAFAERFASERGDSSFRACGGMILFRDPECLPLAQAFVADRRAAGLPVELLDRAAVLDLCPHVGPAVSGAVWNASDAHHDSAAFVRRLAGDFVAEGGTLLAPARVASLAMTESFCTGVTLDDGRRVSAPLTVLATGPFGNALLAPHGLTVPFRPIRFEAAATAPAPFRLDPVLCGQALFRFFVPPGCDPAILPVDPAQSLAPDLGFTEQIASLPDGSLQFGCAYETGSSSDQPTVAGQAMAGAILSRNIPALAALPVTRIWAGVVAQTADGLPVIDAAPGPDGLSLNMAHFFGNLAGTFSGHLLAAALTGGRPAVPLAPFARARLLAA